MQDSILNCHGIGGTGEGAEDRQRAQAGAEGLRITTDNFLTGWSEGIQLIIIIAIVAFGVSWKFLGVYVLAIYSVVRRTPHKSPSL